MTDPRAALKAQLELMQCMLDNVQAHVDEIDDRLNRGDDTTWKDVADFAQIVDLAKASGFI